LLYRLDLSRIEWSKCVSDPFPNGSSAEAAAFDQRMARVAALAAIAVTFVGITYAREIGFIVYGVLFGIPPAVFGLAQSSRKWQAWGWALACVVTAVALVPTILTALRIMRHAHHSDIVLLAFLVTLLLTQAAQLIYVGRAYSGRIAFGTPLLRCTLYYACLLLVVGVSLPNWYVTPVVRRENKAEDTLRRYSSAMELFATTSKDASYPSALSALAPGLEAGKKAPSGQLDSVLLCAQGSCVNNGYRFEYHAVFKQERVPSYTITARPLEFEETGNRSFLLTADGKIFETREDRNALPTDRER
jgi:hypothetical protein